MCTFPVYQIETFEWIEEEKIGSKDSDWYCVRTPAPGLELNERWIFKTPKIFRGEIWAEKIAAEIGQRMGLPTARIELARGESEGDAISGTISLNFADPRNGLTLEPGNELMDAQARVRTYKKHDKDGVLALDAVFDYLNENKVRAPLDATLPDEDAAFYFTGYLVFDALIGNVDRHHQNWGAIRTRDGTLHLAPTFDHGASLSRALGPRKRQNYLNNKQLDQYVAMWRKDEPKSLLPAEVIVLH
ncbi:MAG: HipA domain-containing protein [Bradymonadaceae bacterium]|nr:HipA domain-containing protein [Lujinxingiaceae bacterium]